VRHRDQRPGPGGDLPCRLRLQQLRQRRRRGPLRPDLLLRRGRLRRPRRRGWQRRRCRRARAGLRRPLLRRGGAFLSPSLPRPRTGRGSLLDPNSPRRRSMSRSLRLVLAAGAALSAGASMALAGPPSLILTGQIGQDITPDGQTAVGSIFNGAIGKKVVYTY